MKKISTILFLFLAACGGGSSGGGSSSDPDAGEAPDGGALSLLGTFSFDQDSSDCSIYVDAQNLSVFYNETEEYVRVLDSADDVYTEGYYSSNYSVSYESTLESDEFGEENSNCVIETEDTLALVEICESENISCTFTWYNDDI